MGWDPVGWHRMAWDGVGRRRGSGLLGPHESGALVTGHHASSLAGVHVVLGAHGSGLAGGAFRLHAS